jgi:hypothetical protein
MLLIDGIHTITNVVIVHPTLTKFGFTNNFISQGGHNASNSNKENILP